MKNWGNVFDQDAAGNSVITFAEDDLDGRTIVKGRKQKSATFAAINSVMRMAGVDEACRRVKIRDGKRVSMIDRNEIQRMYQTVSEVMQRLEWETEKAGRLHPKARKLRCSAYVLELFYKRQQMPAHLAKPMRFLSEDLQKEKRKLINSLARQWQRRFRKLHLVQCFTHLALVDKEVDPDAPDDKKTARLYVDRLTDCLTVIEEQAAIMKGEPLARYNQAAEIVLAAFRQNKEFIYAPKWSVEQYNRENGIKESQPKEEKSKKTDAKSSAVKAWKDVKKGIIEQYKEAYKLVCDRPEDERYERELELHRELEAIFSSKPDGSGGRVATYPASPVTNTHDTPTVRGVQNAENAPVASVEPANLLSKNEEKGELDMTHVSYLNADAVRTVEAWESVGAKWFLALLLDDTKPPESDPELALRLSAGGLKKRLPELLRRNFERTESLMIRPDICYKGINRIIHLDELTIEQMPALEPYCFLQFLTSMGKGQGYVALDGKLSDDAFKDFRDRLLDKLNPTRDKSKVNYGSSGSSRWPGSYNKKPHYCAPDGSYPRISIVHVAHGRMVSPLQLERGGFLAAPKPKPVRVSLPPSIYSQGWPDYNYYLNRAPLTDTNKPDRSNADFCWSLRALGMGISVSSVISELTSLSPKAAGRNDYAPRTVNAAYDWLSTHQSVEEQIAV